MQDTAKEDWFDKDVMLNVLNGSQEVYTESCNGLWGAY